MTGLLVDVPGDWRFRALCGHHDDPELWFPVGTTGAYEAQVAEAKAICARCPVKDECLEWSLENYVDAGVWGGLDEGERRDLRRRKGKALARDRHGTLACYDETGCRCDTCKDAKKAANRRKRLAKVQRRERNP